MSKSIMISELSPRGFLSFPPNADPIKLSALNVLIGPNGSGKSNLIESISLIRSSAKSIEDFLRKSGGVREWIWKGDGNQVASVGAVMANPSGTQNLRHVIDFTADKQIFRLQDERIENEHPYGNDIDPYFYYHYQNGNPVINTKTERRALKRETIDLDVSILSQRQDPDQYPEITYLASQYRLIRTYREWSFGRTSSIRDPQRADLRSDRLEEDFSNFGLFLNFLRRKSSVKHSIQTALKELYEGITDFDISLEGGTVQVLLEEQRDFTISATRLSDGTLRYLCLIAILLDPTPPPLLCIEEPELGLHPDIIPKIADLLIEASERTQIVVTTHSDILVDALTKQPESVLVCEKHEGGTHVNRLDSIQLKKWLESYRLGQLWTMGELGGTRW